MTTVTPEEIYQLIKLEDDGVRAGLERFTSIELQSALNKLSEPVKLSFLQRMMVRAFSLDVPAEIDRFTRLIRETLTKKEAQQDLAQKDHLELGFLPSSLK